MTTAAPGQAASLGSRVKERLRQLWPHELPFGHLHRDQDGIPVRMPEAGYGRSRTTHLSVSRLGIDAAPAHKVELVRAWLDLLVLVNTTTRVGVEKLSRSHPIQLLVDIERPENSSWE